MAPPTNQQRIEDLEKLIERQAALIESLHQKIEAGTAEAASAKQADVLDALQPLIDAVKGKGQVKMRPIDEQHPAYYRRNPDNYDVRAAADKRNDENGHEMSEWTAVPNTTHFWHAVCLKCGGTAYARWRFSSYNDPHPERRTDPNTGKPVEVTIASYGGMCYQWTCRELATGKVLRRRGERGPRKTQPPTKPIGGTREQMEQIRVQQPANLG